MGRKREETPWPPPAPSQKGTFFTPFRTYRVPDATAGPPSPQRTSFSFPSWRIPLAQHTQPQSGVVLTVSREPSSAQIHVAWDPGRGWAGRGEAFLRWARESQADAPMRGPQPGGHCPQGRRPSPAGHAEPARRSDPPSPQPRAHLRADSRPLVQRPHRAPRSVGSVRDPRVRREGLWVSGGQAEPKRSQHPSRETRPRDRA